MSHYSASHKMPVVVLISGSGTNLQALLDDSQGSQEKNCPYQVAAVISNRPGVQGLERAKDANVPAISLDHCDFTERELFDQALIETIDQYQPALLVLAGFMRILTSEFVQHYQNRMLNIHPSLLPKYRGLQTHQRALEAGDDEHGLSIHFVTDELDGGPVIIQSKVPILPDDTAETLAVRVQKQEHIVYPKVVRWYAEQNLRSEKGQIFFDGKALQEPLLYQELQTEASA